MELPDAGRGRVAERLADEFGAVLGSEAITRCVDESFDRWSTAPIKTFVPILVERVARERLTALAHAGATAPVEERAETA